MARAVAAGAGPGRDHDGGRSQSLSRSERDEKFLPWHRRHWTEPAREPGDAFVPCGNADLDAIFCVQHERSVAADNTVTVGKLRLQIAPQSSRWSYVKCRVKACAHLDGRWSVRYGPHLLGWYERDGQAVKEKLKRAA